MTKPPQLSLQLLDSALSLRPGRPLAECVRARQRVDPARLLIGQAASAGLSVLPALHARCADAHRLAARLAFDAATGKPRLADDAERGRLDRLTLREHLRRIWLEWPMLLGTAAPAPSLLSASPLLADTNDGEAIRQWLQHVVIGDDAEVWLLHHGQRDDLWLERWLQRGRGVVATMLAPVAARARQLLTDGDPSLPLPPAQQSSEHPAETGCWTRESARPARHALDRLLARVAELLRLSSTVSESRSLRAGAVVLGPRRALGWCEMARGLLQHELSLSDDGSQIAGYRISAPTEWNFHPLGVAARQISRLVANGSAEADCRLIAAALDPCVAIQLQYEDAPCTS